MDCNLLYKWVVFRFVCYVLIVNRCCYLFIDKSHTSVFCCGAGTTWHRFWCSGSAGLCHLSNNFRLCTSGLNICSAISHSHNKRLDPHTYMPSLLLMPRQNRLNYEYFVTLQQIFTQRMHVSVRLSDCHVQQRPIACWSTLWLQSLPSPWQRDGVRFTHLKKTQYLVSKKMATSLKLHRLRKASKFIH